MKNKITIDLFYAETLRKHPVAGNSTRIANKPYKVPNTDITIPKGMRAYIPIYAIHHDERFYENPEEFDPERFSEDNGNDALEFLSFGAGKFLLSHLSLNKHIIFCLFFYQVLESASGFDLQGS